ncbi:hypothetical protein T484DRAFT_1903099, partial [Baffinella frigidus]
ILPRPPPSQPVAPLLLRAVLLPDRLRHPLPLRLPRALHGPLRAHHLPSVNPQVPPLPPRGGGRAQTPPVPPDPAAPPRRRPPPPPHPRPIRVRRPRPCFALAAARARAARRGGGGVRDGGRRLARGEPGDVGCGEPVWGRVPAGGGDARAEACGYQGRGGRAREPAPRNASRHAPHRAAPPRPLRRRRVPGSEERGGRRPLPTLPALPAPHPRVTGRGGRGGRWGGGGGGGGGARGIR